MSESYKAAEDTILKKGAIQKPHRQKIGIFLPPPPTVNNETYGWDIIWIFSISFCSHFRDISHKSQLKQLKKLY